MACYGGGEPGRAELDGRLGSLAIIAAFLIPTRGVSCTEA